MKLSATTTVLLASAVGLAAAQSSDAVGDLPGGEALPSDAAGGAGGIDTDNIPSCFISKFPPILQLSLQWACVCLIRVCQQAA